MHDFNAAMVVRTGLGPGRYHGFKGKRDFIRSFHVPWHSISKMASSMSEAAHAPSRRSLMRGGVRGRGFYSLALFAPKLASMFLLPLYTRYLTPADYGVM